jgi:hypothetical protein
VPLGQTGSSYWAAAEKTFSYDVLMSTKEASARFTAEIVLLLPGDEAPWHNVAATRTLTLTVRAQVDGVLA